MSRELIAIHNTITTLNSNLEQLREESRADSQALLASTRSYQEQMVAANSDALTTALAKVMTEFNSRIEVQYGENFQKFNESLGHLLQWQQSYSSQLDDMLRAQKASIEVISHASNSYEQMMVHSQNFNKVAESLGNLLSGLEQQT